MPKIKKVKKLFIFFSICFLYIILSLFSGCCFPGDSMTRSGVKGRIVYEDGRPVAEEDICFLVPSFYWSSCLKDDLYCKSCTSTDKDGNFFYLFRTEIWPVGVCFIPPMKMPNYPPIPEFVLLLPNQENEGVLIGSSIKKDKYSCVDLEKFEKYECDNFYKILVESEKAEFPFADDNESDIDHKVAGWILKLSITVSSEQM
jgi:hypothetical protein